MKNRVFMALFLSIFLGLSGINISASVENGKIIFTMSEQYIPPPVGHWNPFVTGFVFWALQDWLNEPLAYYITENGTYIPRLATSWEFSPNKDKLTIHLRKGVKFHDGSDFTSKDVLTTWLIQRYLFNRYSQYIDKIEAPDDYTVIFYFKKPSIFAEYWVLSEQRWMVSDTVFGNFSDAIANLLKTGKSESELAPEFEDLRNKLEKFRPEKPVGTGAFKLSKISDYEIILEKFKDHWEASKNYIDEVKIIRWTSSDVWTALTLAGKLDLGPIATPGAYKEIQKKDWAELITVPGYSGPALHINCKIYPLNIREVRQAIAYAINRTEVAVVIRQIPGTYRIPEYQVGTSLPDKFFSKDFLSKLDKYEYNPSKTEQILSSLGFTKGADGVWVTPNGTKLEFDLITPSTYTFWMIGIENIANQLAKVGIKINARGVPRPGWFDRLAEGNFVLAVSWLGEWGYVHPYEVYNWRYIDEATSMFDEVVELPGYGTVNLTEMTISLASAMEPDEQKRILEILGYAFNYYLPAYRLCIYSNLWAINKRDWDGWPKNGDPIYSIYNFRQALLNLGLLKPKFTVEIIAVPSDGGTVEPSSGTYSMGTEITAKATPKSGYKFDHWELDGTKVGTDTTYKFTVKGPHRLVAHFEKVAPPPMGLYAAIAVLAVIVIILAVLYFKRKKT